MSTDASVPTAATSGSTRLFDVHSDPGTATTGAVSGGRWSVRVVIAVLTLLVAVVAALVGVGFTQLVSREAFLEIERSQAMVDHERVLNAWDQHAQELQRLAKDWAWWTDTHRFVQGQDVDAYRESNLNLTTFEGLDLDAVAMLGADGTASFAVEVTDDGYRPLDQALLARLNAHDLAARDRADESVNGLLRASDGRLLLMSNWPVTTSDGAAPPAGSLTFGRWVDEQMADGLQQVTAFGVDLQPTARSDVDVDGGTSVDGFGAQTVSTSSTVVDIDDDPALTVAVTSPRRVASIAARNLSLQRASMVAGALLAGIVLLAAINRLVIRRVRELQTQVTAIGSGHQQRYVNVDGRDEIAQLAVDVNRMLDGLEQMSARADHYQEADALKGRLLALISHELRTPLTVISGFAETLRHRADDMDPDLRDRALDKIREHVATLDGRIGHLLLVADADRDGITTDCTDVAVAQRITDVLAAHPTVDVTVDMPDGLAVYADPDHLWWIVDELLTNAQRYAPGPVHITARREPAGTVTITVTDQGHGVPDRFLPRLFQPFEQASTGDRRTANGVGLGLAHARTLARANGGGLTYEPAEQGGARFVLHLFAGRTPTSTRAEGSSTVPAGMAADARAHDRGR